MLEVLLAIGWLAAAAVTGDEAPAPDAKAADLTARMKTCSAQQDDRERLACYDRVMRGGKTEKLPSPTSTAVNKTVPALPTGTAKWQVSFDKNPVDDSITVTALLEADEGESDKGEKSTLVLRCRSNETELYITWGGFIGGKAPQVLTRIGNAPPDTFEWAVSSNREGTFFPGNDIAFIRRLLDTNRLVAQMTPYQESPITAVFDLRGIRAAVRPIQQTCGWK
jgi:type VI secretion system protein VasI